MKYFVGSKKILLCFFLCCSLYRVGAQEFQDIYGDFADFYDFLRDPDTGLTVFPILTIPVGGEFEGMGTAYTAIARDSSFFDANPAGSAFLEYTELSFLHNNWIADTNIEGLVYTRRSDYSGFAVAAKFLYVPFTGYNIWGERTGSGHYTEAVAIFNYAHTFFSSYEFDGIALGTNLKAALRHIPESIATGQSAVGFMADFGVLTRFDFLKFYASRRRNASVGIALRNVGPFVQGEPLPTALSIGLGYWPLRPWVLAFDINIPISFDPHAFPAENIGFALGTSVTLTNFFAMQSGLLLKGGNPRFSLGSSVDLDPVTIVVNYTLDMTTQVTNLDRFSIQLRLNLGDEGRKARVQKVENLYLSAVEAFAAGNFQKSLELANQVLSIDPKFTPARETIQLIERSIRLQREMEERQRIE